MDRSLPDPVGVRLQTVKPSRAIAVLGVAALVTTACSKPKGTIAGHFYRVGGPPPGLPSPMPGTIYVSGEESPVTAGPDGSFSAVVPVGTYTLSGRSPQINDGNDLCYARRSVTVRADAVAKVDVICDVP